MLLFILVQIMDVVDSVIMFRDGNLTHLLMTDPIRVLIYLLTLTWLIYKKIMCLGETVQTGRKLHNVYKTLLKHFTQAIILL